MLLSKRADGLSPSDPANGWTPPANHRDCLVNHLSYGIQLVVDTFQPSQPSVNELLTRKDIHFVAQIDDVVRIIKLSNGRDQSVAPTESEPIRGFGYS